jgi:hypothetical protein
MKSTSLPVQKAKRGLMSAAPTGGAALVRAGYGVVVDSVNVSVLE